MAMTVAAEPQAAVPAEVSSMTLDGEEVTFAAGETVFEAAERSGREVPTLCYDPRLEPLGSCRLCVVEVEGSRAPVASCTTLATPGMVVRTSSDTLEKYRRTLLEMVVSENREVDVDPLRGYASQELKTLVDQYGARTGRFGGARSGATQEADDNPFILRDYDLCISCNRCVRVCAEQEGDHAINIMNRGFHTRITTEFDGLLKDSACTFCGQCVQTCPTGALADRKAMRAASVPGPIEKTRPSVPTAGSDARWTCSARKIVWSGSTLPWTDRPTRELSAWQFAFDFVQHSDRLRTPLVRGEDGELHEAGWDEALDRAAEGFRRALAEHGRHSIYGVASGRAPNEAAYVMQKFIRAGFGTHQIDNCSRA